MADFIGILVYATVFFLLFKWLYKTYFKEPTRDKKIGEFKFQEFQNSMNSYNILRTPIKANEFCLAFRENITNGVETIGNIDYSINDYIKVISGDKKHNYYFEVQAKIGEFLLTKKSSNYYPSFTEALCKEQVQILRSEIVGSKDYQIEVKKRQLR